MLADRDLTTLVAITDGDRAKAFSEGPLGLRSAKVVWFADPDGNVLSHVELGG